MILVMEKISLMQEEGAEARVKKKRTRSYPPSRVCLTVNTCI